MQIRNTLLTLSPVPAQAMPRAIAAPYLTWGLYDSASSDTTLGHCSGVLEQDKQTAIITSSNHLACYGVFR